MRDFYRWGILLGIILGVVLVAGAAQGISLTAYSAPEAAPNAQATATSTNTPSPTPTNTNTPGPAMCSIGGVPLYCPHSSGGNVLGVSVEGGSNAFPYGANTPIPVSGNTPVATRTADPVVGLVAVGTPVPGRPVIIGVEDFSGNAIRPVAGAADDQASASQVRVGVSALGVAHDDTTGQDVRLRAEPTTHRLLVANNTPLPTWTPQTYYPGQVAVAVTMVLPAQTPVAYTAFDAIAAATPVAITFANMCRSNGGSGTITAVRQITDQSGNVARFKWHVYATAPTPIADNAPFTMLYANASIRLGAVEMPPNASEGAGSTAAAAQNFDVRLPYTCAANDTSLYVLGETLDAFTPNSAQGITVSVQSARD